MEYRLSKMEYELLVYFLQNRNQLLTRDQIWEAIWGAKEREHFLWNIREEALKSEWLLKNLVDASRLESGAIQFQAEPEYLAATLYEAVQEVYPMAREKEITIVTEEFEDRLVLHNRRWTKGVCFGCI